MPKMTTQSKNGLTKGQKVLQLISQKIVADTATPTNTK